MHAFVQRAWDKALGLLNPSDAHLRHGLGLHRDSLVFDLFGFAPYIDPPDVVDLVREAFDAGASATELSQLLLSLRQLSATRHAQCHDEYVQVYDHAGVNAHVQTVGNGNTVSTLSLLSRFVHLSDRRPRLSMRARDESGVLSAAGEHRHALVFSLNSPLGASARQADPLQVLAGLDTAHHLGVKFMHLTYNRRNAIGDGCAEPEDAGLTDLGRRVIEQMNRLQIVVDVSHAGLRTGLEAAASSTRPIAATHTAAGALSPHIRAKSDQVIRAIADSGGLIGVCVIPPFLGRTGDIRAMLDHVDYIAKLVGVAHVAIGTDIGYHPPPPADVEERIAQRRASDAAPSTQWPADDPILQAGAFDECHHGSLAWTNWPLFTVGLVQRGYADVDVRGIIGGNALRLIRTSGGTE